MLRRSIQVPLIIVLLAGGVLISSALNHGSTRHDATAIDSVAAEAPSFSILSGRERLIIRGTTQSKAHEGALLQVVADHFDGFDVQTDFTATIILAGEWESISSRLLYAVAAMDSAQAVMRDSSISIRGVTSDEESYQSRFEFLREILPDDVLVDADVLTSNRAASTNEVCARVFSHLIVEPVAFKESSAEIRSSSLVTLDRIIEFAHDCQRAAISITGHTDASGNESWNHHLSLIRARAVADYLIDRGVDLTRLTVVGRGSTEPVADNSTVLGRDLNRRIEFALLEN